MRNWVIRNVLQSEATYLEDLGILIKVCFLDQLFSMPPECNNFVGDIIYYAIIAPFLALNLHWQQPKSSTSNKSMRGCTCISLKFLCLVKRNFQFTKGNSVILHLNRIPRVHN